MRSSLSNGLPIVLLLVALPRHVLAEDMPTYPTLVNEFNQHVIARRFAEAEPVGKRLLECADREFPDDANVQFLTVSLVESAYSLQDRLDDAEPLLTRAVALSQRIDKVAPENLPSFVTGLYMLAMDCSKLQRHSEAVQLRKRALQIVEGVRGPMHPDLMQPLINLGAGAAAEKHYRDAEYYWRINQNLYYYLSGMQDGNPVGKF